MSAFGAIGAAADIGLIVLTVLQCLLGWRLFHTVILHLRHRRTGLAHERALLAKPLPPDDELPAVLVQIPTYNEGVLVERALAAAVALDWPRDRIEIQILDDSTDSSLDIARQAVAAYRECGHRVTLVHREHRSGFKAGALKAGLALSDQPFIAILDADYVPPPDFLRLCMRPLLQDRGLAFSQARCDFLNANENLVTRTQQVMLESHFAVEQVTRSWAGQCLPFNGTCGIWRREAIDDAGGWQGDTLTEDLDLSYRADLAGWRALYLVSVGVPGELPDTVATWRRQQLRWNKGYAQTARKLLPRIGRSAIPVGRKFEALLHLSGCTFGVMTIAGNVLFNIDFVLGTMTYRIVLPLAVYALVQSIAGATAMALLSRGILQIVDPGRAQTGLRERCRLAACTIGLQMYAGIITGVGVLDGMRGGVSPFVRTPKKGAVVTRA